MTDFEGTVLQIVDRVCTFENGYPTWAIAERVGRQPGHDSDAAHSQFTTRALLSLERAGRVRRLDDERPLVWCRVQKTA